jgi:hypothetical protein
MLRSVKYFSFGRANGGRAAKNQNNNYRKGDPLSVMSQGKK